MAGKKQETDNSKFVEIAGQFSKYSDLTREGKNLVLDAISTSAGRKGYPAEKVYYVFYHCGVINRERVLYWLQYYYGIQSKKKGSSEMPPNDDMARKFVTICNKLAVTFPEAHKNNIELFKKKKEGHTYITEEQKYTIDRLYDMGGSVEEMIIALQKMIDVEK
ncbi:hypothetical protein DN462_25865 [Citrobacter freundii]|uniref:Uncharacterized protein n=1 Tax=Citrobacter freundii TaxID=546 RepID=A0AAN4JEK9_CITFR|nr:hypothetical protein [Citrobacter freundii]EKW2110636.1 hypothetical protein [Citrobacter freundii]RWS82677.1 hypothetical protein DN462_25865 [Citrobacter freundii]